MQSFSPLEGSFPLKDWRHSQRSALLSLLAQLRAPADSRFLLFLDPLIKGLLSTVIEMPSLTNAGVQQIFLLDRDREAIICSIHGATYDPLNGRCVGGPCVGARLTALRVEERDAQVYWYPSSDIKPMPVALPRDDGTEESPP